MVLYNMVRIIAGTLVEVGLEKIEPEKIEEIIKRRKKRKCRKNTSSKWFIFS